MRNENCESVKEKKNYIHRLSLNHIKVCKTETNLPKREMSLNNQNFIFETINSNDRIKIDKKASTFKSSKEKGKTNSRSYSDSYNIRTSDIQIINKIDEGAYGEVKLAKYQGNLVALKYYKKNGKAQEQLIEEFTKEIRALDQLRHPNILFYMGYFYEKKNFVMVSEFASGGSLFNLLHKKKDNLGEEEIIKIIKQIVEAMIYTHSNTCNVFRQKHVPL